MHKVIELLKPIVIGWLTSPAASKLLIEVLEKLAAKSDNEVDDALVRGLARALRVED